MFTAKSCVKTVTLFGLAIVAASPVLATQEKKYLGRVAYHGSLPADDYQGRHWRSDNNCDYSRAGRDGETVWYLISNTAHKGCASYIVQKAHDDFW